MENTEVTETIETEPEIVENQSGKKEKKKKERPSEESLLDQPITIKFLIKFTLPTILSFVIMGIFGLVDGLFAMRGINYAAFAAVSVVWPFASFSMALAAMLTMGGCALVAKLKGKNEPIKARQVFSLLALVTFVVSATISIVGWFLREPIVRLLGARGGQIPLAIEYIEPLILMAPFIMLGMFFVQFMIAEGRPTLGMAASVSGSIVSTSLNAIFLFVFDMGLMGLSLATGIGYSVPAIIGALYFALNRKGTIFFVRPKWDIGAIGRASLNGISEAVTMMAHVAMTIVLNNTLMDIGGNYYVGRSYQAVAGIVLGAQWIFASLFFGFVAALAPIVSYNYGKKKKHGKESEVGTERYNNLKLLYKKGLICVAVLSLLAIVLANAFAGVLVRLYDLSPNCPYTSTMYTQAVRGIRLVSIGFILMGFNVFATGWFTAFNDGLVSGAMSVVRSLVFTTILLATLPRAIGLDGAWAAIPIAESLAIFVTIFFLWKMSKKYHYK